ncbi:MAG: PQQ-binding-like beta-propeller repeat protein, partial [bacterium]
PTLGGGLAGFTSDGEELQVLAFGLWIAPSPIAVKNVAYFGGYDSTFYLYDFFLGHPIRTVKTRGSIVTAPTLTPLNRVLFGSLDSKIYAINRDGEVLWRKKLDSPLSHHPTASEGGLCYALTETGTLYALDEETGETLWIMEKQVLFPPSLNYSGDLTLLTRTGEVARVGKLGSIKWLSQGPSLPSAPPITDYFGALWVPFEANRLVVYSPSGDVAAEFETPSPLIALVPTGAKSIYGISQNAQFIRFRQAV